MATGNTSHIPISLSRCGSPIPRHLRQALERLLDSDLSTVRLHIDPRLARIGAHASPKGKM